MNLFNIYKRGENLKETLRIDMTKIREKNTNWYDTILSFFRDEETENEQNNEYEKWKKENADILNSTEIENLEKMLEHKDKKKTKKNQNKIKNSENKVRNSEINKTNLDIKEHNEKDNTR